MPNLILQVVAPRMCTAVVDRAIQSHGGAGLHSDLPLSQFYATARSGRLFDGPDEVMCYCNSFVLLCL